MSHDPPDQGPEFSALVERLYRLRADLETALQDAEDQRDLIAKLRAEAQAIWESVERRSPR
jgi:hypothetical protein